MLPIGWEILLDRMNWTRIRNGPGGKQSVANTTFGEAENSEYRDDHGQTKCQKQILTRIETQASIDYITGWFPRSTELLSSSCDCRYCMI